ncbi:tRNA pseudouridine(38-40) synthase TruA [Fusibacter sp. 3D3]|uniref:tRNA pseudouridine(38-40) synthase TruA n=1 Tax=Fusibacter sp. 3D3 TaxID=1048380 RepID=UPI000852AD35|nr:tRNA pseudouridine(38-40) synthase TruA [Fusibacter sp. 3D3]
MKNMLMVISYDGSEYKGWQRQPSELSIQGTIEKTLKRLLKEEITIDGAGRTDAGVHSIKGQTATFNLTTHIEAEPLRYALNRALPRSIHIDQITTVPDTFHARYHALGKTYRYIIDQSLEASPLRAKYVHHLDRPLDFKAIRLAMQHFVGTHDFKTFMASGSKIEDTVRTLYSFTLEQYKEEYHFTISGDGFLYNMIRIIMGSLIQVGDHKIEPDEIRAIIESKERSRARYTAPANGLYLIHVEYAPNIFYQV